MRVWRADVVMGDNVVIEADVTVGEGCVLGHNVVIRTGSRLGCHVTVGDNTVIGRRPMRSVRSALPPVTDYGGVQYCGRCPDWLWLRPVCRCLHRAAGHGGRLGDGSRGSHHR